MPAKKKVAKKSKAKKATTNPKKTVKKSPTKKSPTKKKVVSKKTAKKSAKKTTKKASASKPVAPVKKAAPAKPKIPASAKYLKDKKWLKAQKEELILKRASYTQSADKLAADAAALMADREPGDVQFDEESGEGDTLAVERDRDLALSAKARQSVEEIDLALERLEKGTYGMCVAADDAIPKARLEYMPEASVCVEHKTSMFI